jgi:hypothetical protein
MTAPLQLKAEEQATWGKLWDALAEVDVPAEPEDGARD